MRYLVLVFAFAMSLASTSHACMMSLAQVKAISIADFNYVYGVCRVPLRIERTTPDKNCPLQLEIDQELIVNTSIPEEECHSLDEEGFNGTISTGGGVYIFTSSEDQ